MVVQVIDFECSYLCDGSKELSGVDRQYNLAERQHNEELLSIDQCPKLI